jgi:hypothetical protein
VPGLLVSDFDQAVRELDRLPVEWLTEISSASGRQWRHYRAADGNVYEVMGPLPAVASPATSGHQIRA